MRGQRDRLTNVCQGKLGQIRLGDKAAIEVSGPQIVVGPNPETGRPQQVMGWQLAIWLEHNKLVAQDPIGVTVGLMGLLPPRMAFERATEMLLEEARRIRDKANSPELPEFTDEQRREIMRAAHQGADPKAGPVLPPASLPTEGEPKAKPEPPKARRERESHFS